ncbi:hypothetical protein DFP97_10719 [Paenibacillus prosopidis]|uniref:Uncharacterized protein n=1 Tax=Paenibacillus prosopidis TaxID=630520 RepID=A0A368W048_9BACL|nr:hypothetical protein DFP97_10719 [Paenibacillus prosopidis]
MTQLYWISSNKILCNRLFSVSIEFGGTSYTGKIQYSVPMRGKKPKVIGKIQYSYRIKSEKNGFMNGIRLGKRSSVHTFLAFNKNWFKQREKGGRDD